MTDADPGTRQLRVGRPRDAKHDESILEATKELLASEGYDGLTIEAVAERAGVSRPTVYRRWPDKAHLVLATVAAGAGPPSNVDRGSLRGDLGVILRQNVRLLESAVFRHTVPALLARLSTDQALADAYVRDFVDLRRAQVVAALDRAVARGEIAAPSDVDAVFDLLIGAVFYRVIVRRQKVTRRFIEMLLECVVATVIPVGS